MANLLDYLLLHYLVRALLLEGSCLVRMSSIICFGLVG
ncbi:hypothetical protein LINPERPRIM_LOCUS42597 [Linum perenne]